MYTVEFQKSGPPHAHYLIILDDNYKLLTAESYDNFFFALNYKILRKILIYKHLLLNV